MDWDTVLMKRAKQDLEMFDTFNKIKIDNTYGVIIIKDGKFNYKRNYKHNPEELMYPREMHVKQMFKMIDTSDLPDVQIPVHLMDSYDWAGNFSFVWAKPYSKKGLLFPSWEFDDWDTKVKNFNNAYIPWKDRSDEPYFKGRDTTFPTSNIRKILRGLFPDYIHLDPIIFTENEAKYKQNKTYEPTTNLIKHKIVLDIPGTKPWSVRTPYIYLSGSASLRIFHYYPRWNEKPWIQFFEEPKDLHGLMLESNWEKPLKEEQIEYLQDEMPKQFRLLHGKRAQNRAEKMREKMKSLTTKHMLTYIKFICNYIGEKQDL